MRWNTLACLGGGLLLAFSFSSSKEPIRDDGDTGDRYVHRVGDDRGTRDTRGNIRSVLQPDSLITISIDRGLLHIGGENFNPSELKPELSTFALPPEDGCVISPGTGCPHFLETAEWVTMAGRPGAFVATPIPANKADAENGDGGDDDDDDADGEGDDGSVDHAVDHDEGDHSGDDFGLGWSNCAGAFLPVEHTTTIFCAWPWRLLRVRESEEALDVKRRIIRTRYGKSSYRRQASSAPVPNPVCLAIYVVVILVAAYRGNPRRGLKRIRRLQRCARSSRCAKLQVARRKRRDGVAVQMSFVSPFAFFRPHSFLAYIIELQAKWEKTSRDAKVLETCENVTTATKLDITASTTPAPSTREQNPAWKLKPLSTCTQVIKPNKKDMESGSRAANTPLTGPVPVRIPARPVEWVSFSKATSSVPSPADILLAHASNAAMKANIQKSAVPPASSPNGNKTVDAAELCDTRTKKNQEHEELDAARKVVATTPTPRAPGRTPAKPTGAVSSSETTSVASSTMNVVLDPASCTEKGSNLKTAAISSAANTPLTGPDPVRIPARPVGWVAFSKATSSIPPPTDSLLAHTSNAAMKANIQNSAVPPASSPNGNKTVDAAKLCGTRTKQNQEHEELDAARKVVATTPTPRAPGRIPAKPTGAVSSSETTSVASSTMNVVLDPASCTDKGSNLKTAAISSALSAGEVENRNKVKSLGTCKTRVSNNKKTETDRNPITATFTTPLPVRISARPAQAVQVPPAISSSTSGVHSAVGSASCAAQPSIYKPTVSISAVASARNESTGGKHHTCKEGASGKNVLETTSMPMATTSTAVPSSACTTAKPQQAIPLATAKSSGLLSTDLILSRTSREAQTAKIKPVVNPPSTSAGNMRNTGRGQRRGTCKNGFKEKLESAVLSITAAPSSPYHTRTAAISTSGEGSRQDTQSVKSPGATSPSSKMDPMLRPSSRGAKTGPTLVPMPLEKVEGLYTSLNPAILGVRRWFDGYVINIDPDGNCFGTSWLITAIVWAAKQPSRLNALISKLEHAGGHGNLFGILDERSMGYVDDLIEYLKSLQRRWIGHAENDETCGVFLAVDVVKMFMGDRLPGYVGMDSKDGREPDWLKCKWGVAIASRSLDAWTAVENNFDVDLDKLRTLGQSVTIDFGPLQDTGVEGHTPAADVLRPGGSIGVLTGLVIDNYVSDGNCRNPHDFTTALVDALKTPQDRITTGLAVHKTGLPHFDILLTPLPGRVDELFFVIFAATFDLPDLDGEDIDALDTLRLSVESQQVTSTDEINDFLPDGELGRQVAAMKAYEEAKARGAQSAAEPTQTQTQSRNNKKRGKRRNRRAR